MKEFEQRSAVVTGDGSRTLFHAGVGEHYHSRHGAVSESRHVFVGMGLDHFASKERATKNVSVLEVGFGTGLNFLLSASYAHDHSFHLTYSGIEAFPLPVDTLAQLDYGQYVDDVVWSSFLDAYAHALAEPDGSRRLEIASQCTLEIIVSPLLDVALGPRTFDVIYFDAFAAVHQPELWTREVFEKVTAWMGTGSVFVTYAITGALKRTLRDLGLRIEKLPGAPGKREMLRATL